MSFLKGFNGYEVLLMNEEAYPIYREVDGVIWLQF